MGLFDSDSDDDDSWGRARDGIRDLQARIERNGEAERAWYKGIDEFISDPQLLDQKTKAELDHLRIRAEGCIEELENKSNAVRTLARGTGAPGFGDLFTGLASSFTSEKVGKNRTLVRLIEAKQNRDRMAIPSPSRNEQFLAARAERERERQELITLLQKQCYEEKRKHPEQAESIDRRYRKLIEAVIEEE